MPTLPTKSFTVIVQMIASGIQGRATKMINFAIGSAMRAVAEGFAAVFLWFQTLVLQLLSAIRLSTASGIDVDTFTADFMPLVAGTSSPRLGAQSASGQVTFARFTAGPSTCFIPVGATVETTDGSQQFTVTADATYPTYSAQLNGYTLASTVGSIIVPVAATVPGNGGNVAAGSITVITSALTGIDTVINNASFTNGANQESDSALKKRFSDYILGLSRGDIFGLNASIEGSGVTVQWALTEDYNLDGSWRPGYFFVVADDGSGNPSPSFLQVVTNAANAVRPLSVQCGVFPPTIIWATVSMILGVAPGYDRNAVIAEVVANISTTIDSLGLGNRLPFSSLAGMAFAVAGVTDATAITLNGNTGDAASLEVTRLAQDGIGVITFGTVKAQSVIVQ